MQAITREDFRREVRAKQAEILEGVGKVSSPELASLAAKYVNIDTLELMDLDRTAAFELCMDVRSLAASVLAQAEGEPSE